MTLGYDAVEVGALPAGADFYLAYVDGDWPTHQAVAARFPFSRLLTVTVTGDVSADIIDVEYGNAPPEVAAEWLRRGMGHTVYSSLSTKPALDAACAGQVWSWYAADPTGVEHLVAGSVATQYAWAQLGQTTGNFDISTADSAWLGMPSPPKPHPQPVPSLSEAPNMQCTDPTTGGVWCLDTTNGGIYSYAVGNSKVPPYLGAPNVHPEWGINPAHITGISAVNGPGGWGYTVSVSRGPGQGFSLYAFTRDGRYAK